VINHAENPTFRQVINFAFKIQGSLRKAACISGLAVLLSTASLSLHSVCFMRVMVGDHACHGKWGSTDLDDS